MDGEEEEEIWFDFFLVPISRIRIAAQRVESVVRLGCRSVPEVGVLATAQRREGGTGIRVRGEREVEGEESVDFEMREREREVRIVGIVAIQPVPSQDTAIRSRFFEVEERENLDLCR